MAQNITLLGASYTDVPGVQLPKTGGGTALFSDASVTTATAADVASGKLFLASDGAITTGTNSGGGGGSAYTLLGSSEFTVQTTSTSSGSVGKVYTSSAIWTKNKIIYFKVRDKAGKRAGYFYGGDCWLAYNNAYLGGETSGTTVAASIGITYRVNAQGSVVSYGSTSRYGVYGYGIYGKTTAGEELYYADFYRRYSSTYSLTIDSTYICEVYLLDWPDGNSPLIDP